MKKSRGLETFRKKSGESGQATIEFALVLVLLMSFIFFYIQLGLIMAWGSYVHYATFMAARAYMAGSANESDQHDRAKSVLLRMVKKSSSSPGVDRLPFVAKGVGGDPKGVEIGPGKEFQATNRDFSWEEGVRYTFKSKLFMIPMGGSSKGGNVNSVTLTSESWLGREPTYEDCLDDMATHKGILDNGC